MHACDAACQYTESGYFVTWVVGVMARVGVGGGGWAKREVHMMVLLPPLPLPYFCPNQSTRACAFSPAPPVMIGHQGIPAGEVDAYVASVIAARFNVLDTAAIVAKGGKPPPAAKAPAAKAPAAKGA
jgi:hypothetical protein